MPLAEPMASAGSSIPVRSSARDLISGTGWQTVAQFLPLIANLAITPYVIHGLGASRFSVFLLIATFANLIGQFDGGVGASALRFCALYAGRGDRVATTRLLTTVSAGIVLICLPVVLLVVLLTPHILGFFAVAPQYVQEASILLRVLTALVALILWRNLYHAVLAAHHRFRTLSLAGLVSSVVYAGGLVLAARYQWDLTSIALIMVAQQVVNAVITIPTGLRYLDRRGVCWAPRAERREFLGYAWKAQLAGLVTIAVSQKDQLVAGRVVSAQDSGPFSQGYGLAFQLRTLPANAMKPIQAATGAEVGAHGPAVAVVRVQQMQRIWVCAVTGWCAIGIPASYVGIRAWLPDSFALTGLIVAILFTGHFFTLLSMVSVIWALTLGYAGMDLRATTVGFVVNITCSVVLGMAVGMIGVVCATALGQLVAMLYFSWDSRRRLSTRLRWFLLDVPWVAGLLSALVCAAGEALAAPHLPRGVLGLLSAGLTALPAGVLFTLLAFGRGERERIWQLVRPGRID